VLVCQLVPRRQPGNDTAAFLAGLATFGAGFAVRPPGALVFGRLGDLIGRKYTFLITIVVMGLSTALVGEYGGAATYVAEHAPPGQRGYYTTHAFARWHRRLSMARYRRLHGGSKPTASVSFSAAI
jgi:MFS family permease